MTNIGSDFIVLLKQKHLTQIVRTWRLSSKRKNISGKSVQSGWSSGLAYAEAYTAITIAYKPSPKVSAIMCSWNTHLKVSSRKPFTLSFLALDIRWGWCRKKCIAWNTARTPARPIIDFWNHKSLHSFLLTTIAQSKSTITMKNRKPLLWLPRDPHGSGCFH